MTNPVIQFKRGTETQCDAVTPVAGEPLWDTENNQLRVGDAVTAGGNKVAMEGDAPTAHAASHLTGGGDDIDLSAQSVSRTFLANAFNCPAPGTDWTPQLEGCHLAASKSAKKFWIPLNFLKIGDIITSYKLVGDAVEVTALTLDCKLVQINKADPLTTTDITNGAIVQVTADGNFDVEANPDDTTVATDKQYVLEVLGTTDTSDEITVMGAEVVVTRLV